MDQFEARRILDVAHDATVEDVRRAFRRLVLEHHPDRAGGDGDATRLVVEAYRTLEGPAAEANPLGPLLAGGTLELDLPPDEAFLAVLDAASDLGDVTYVDPEAGLVEVVLHDGQGGRTSLVLTLQGRAASGTTEVFGTFEPLA
jgi:hypothetical protein